MFKAGLKRIFGGGSSGTPPRDAALLETFAYLDQVEAGFAERLVGYVTTGDDRAVLPVLQAKSIEISEALVSHRRAEARKTQKNFNDFYAPRAASEAMLPRAILTAKGDPERIVRLIEAGMCADLLMTGTYHGYRQNTDLLTIEAVNLYRTLAHPEENIPLDQRLGMDDVIAASTAMKVDLETLIASGLWIDWRGLGYLGYEWISAATVEEFSRALKQMDAAKREALLEICVTKSVQPQGDTLPLWFDLTDDGAAKVRDAARKLILASDDPRVTPMAIERLSSGKAAQRATMAQVLGEIASPEAVAALKDRQTEEKTRAVQLLIDQLLSSDAAPQDDPDKPGYAAVDGGWITPPEAVVLVDDGAKPFGSDDEAELRDLAQKDHHEQIERSKRAAEAGHRWDHEPRHDDSWKDLLATFNGSENDKTTLDWIYLPWVTKAIKRASDARLLRLWALSATDDIDIYTYGSPVGEWIDDQIDSGALDIRSLIAAVEDVRRFRPDTGRRYNQEPRRVDQSISEWMLQLLLTGRSYTWQGKPDAALWPLIADHLPLLAENLPPHELSSTQNLRALRLVKRLPAIPRMLVPALINASTAEARTVRSAAQALLADVADVTPQVVAALGDSRQAIRANAAAFLGQRGDDTVLPDLIALMGKEKSDLVRASLISAISALGGDTTKWLGKAALEKDAAANARKLKADKIDWLAMDTAPILHWQDGKPVADNLLDGWLKLAVKLKTLEDGAGLFKLYLAQLRPQDAAALGDWALSSWIAYDTTKPAREAIYREELERAKQHIARYQNTPYYKDLTPEQLAENWTRAKLATYPNSGAASKGILALALDATPLTQARLASGYLKNHGKRVAQAKAMVELLALSGTPEALQVVVATATRFKQRSVREMAETLVERIAEERGWTADELADRSVPSGGLEEGGLLDLPMGEDARPYQARLDSGLVLHLHNPDGKIVKSLPAGTDENSKESKALLTNAKKVLKEVVEKQSRRLYEAMLTGREWALPAWQADLREHPIVGRLVERAIWRGLDAEGQPIVTFRPTAEGDLMTASGDDADLTGVEKIDLAHGTALSPEDLAAWTEHLADFEVAPLFAQIGRPILTLSADQADADAITDREGWMMDNLKLRGLAAKLGYDPGAAEDGGSVTSYEKRIDGLGYRAEIIFSGTYFGADTHPVALISMQFFSQGRRRSRPVPLAEVPPRLLSECWNDLHDIAKSGAYDPEWKKKGLW